MFGSTAKVSERVLDKTKEPVYGPGSMPNVATK